MWQLSVVAIFVLFAFAETLSVFRTPSTEDDSSIQICDPNEFFDPCSGCEATCTSPGPIACRRICIRPGRCLCLKGYVRSSDGECVKPEECLGPATTDEPISGSTASGDSGDLDCAENEHLNDCGGCDGTCENPNPMCIALCGKPACRCSTGFVRHGGRCIPAELCPPPNLTPCSNFRCGWGQKCVVIRGQARCVGPRQEDPCALIDCVSGKVCKVQDGKPACVDAGAPTNPCAVTLCPAGTECVLVPLNCFVAPCPPDEAMCVPIKTTTGPNRG